MSNESYAETWDPERAYKRLKKAIIRMQAKENPNSMDVCEHKQVRMSLCANGTCPVDLFEQAFEQLFTHNEIAYGEVYACYPNNRDMATRAIEFVADQEKVDSAFIGRMNQLVSSGVLDSS